jgi:hypothetical protein
MTLAVVYRVKNSDILNNQTLWTVRRCKVQYYKQKDCKKIRVNMQ